MHGRKNRYDAHQKRIIVVGSWLVHKREIVSQVFRLSQTLLNQKENSMPLTGTVLNPDSMGANVRELHEQLLAIGAPIASNEQTATTFGPSTVAAVRAFRQRHGLPAGDAVDLSTGRLMHVASVFAGAGDRVALRAAVREAASAADTSQSQELYWLARYATLAGDYETAHAIARRIPNHADVRAVIDPILALPDQQPHPPELTYPENFYTYHFDLVPRGLLAELLNAASGGPLRRRPRGPDGENDFPDDLPEPPPDPPSDSPDVSNTSADQLRANAVQEAARSWIEAADQWRQGNEHFEQRRYAKAAGAYEASQRAALRYFETFYGLSLSMGRLIPDRMTSLVAQLFIRSAEWPHLWDGIQQRRLFLSLAELHGLDWDWFSQSAEDLLRDDLRGLTTDNELLKRTRQQLLDHPMLILATVFVPLARAEANRARRQYAAAAVDLSRVLTPFRIQVPFTGDPNRIRLVSFTCDFIERPFAQLLKAEILLDQADAEYKAQTPAAEPPAADVSQFQGLKAAQTYLAVKDVFKDEGAYVSRTETAATELTQTIQQRLAANDTRSPEFQLLGKDILVPTLTSASTTLPGLDRRTKAHEPLLKVTPPEDQEVMRETNPRVYAALLTATARLEQLKAGFNYLGYLDTYVSPWRFQFLLERARYFAEHAKNAQRDYLNLLSNAEHEEFQELSTSQNVEMEKSNVRIETARVDQVQLEVKATQESLELAKLHAANAGESFERYQQFDDNADRIMNTAGTSKLTAGFNAIGEAFPVAGAIFEGVGDFFTGGFFSSSKRKQVEAIQREVEKNNLRLAAQEAREAAGIAKSQLDTAEAGLVVAGLQRQAALLRHEFAVQNLEFLRDRVLNSEQWYRLVAAIRSVSETYLRYSVELAFLAEQAYEFEADKRINVIRFDYDLSDVGGFLAADFLLRDLDTLEQDLVVTQRQRQQEVRYVLSMAREFPEALQEIRDRGKTTFSLRLEQFEKRFPGLYNLRIGAVDVLPVALMDSTRFSLELTHLGTSQVRLKAQPDTPPSVPSPSPLNQNDLEQFLFAASANGFADELDQGTFSDQFREQFTENGVNIPSNTDVTKVEAGSVWRLSSIEIDENFLVRKKEEELYVYLIEVDDDWLIGIRDEWPVKMRVTGPETAVFSGLTRQDASAVFAFATTGQRQAFEALGAGAAWQVDLTARENQVVPGTLADLLITLTLSGYHDPELRSAIDRAPRATTAVTRFLSGRDTFPDALYEFNRSGRMVWNLTRDLLALTDTLGKVRNAAVLLLPTLGRTNYFGRLMSQYQVQVRIDEATGDLEVLSEIPQVTFELGDAANPLLLTAHVTLVSDGEMSWDFGDGSERQSGADQQHSYAKPGRYTVSLRVVRDGRLSEFRADVVVSRSHADRLSPPVTAFPSLTRDESSTGIPDGHTRVVGTVNTPAADPVTATWRVGDQAGIKGNSATFDLKPDDYTLFFTAVRRLKARVYCTQRHLTGPVFDFNGLSLASGRRFELDGSETTGVGDNPPASPVTTHLFGEETLSPVDEWTVELPLADNAFLRSVGTMDAEQYDLAEIEDVVLALEYETTPGSS